jgi:hypothetical protein
LALNSRLERTMRRFLHDLTMLAAVTAAGGFALTRASSPSPPRPGLALTPMYVAETAPLDDAMDVLRTTSEFADASVGYGGVVPTQVVAWLTVLHDSDAEIHFLELLRTATPAGRIYALAGLRATNPKLFRDVAAPFRRDRVTVTTFFGCIVSEMTTSQLVAELDQGAWIGEFVSASRSRYFGDLPWPQ